MTLEIIAAGLSLAGIALLAKLNRAGWILSILASLLYGAVFYSSEYPAQASLQLVFIVTSVYGYLNWGGSLKAAPRTIHPLLPALVIVSAGAMTLLFQPLSPKDYVDIYSAVLSLAATVFSAKRYTVNWALWVGIDLCLACSFLVSGLLPTALLYLVFTVLAVFGLREWENCDVSPFHPEALKPSP